MNFLIKKTKDNPRGEVDLKELLHLLGISDLKVKLDSLQEQLNEFDISLEDKKTEILTILKQSLLELNTPINIENIGGIEKNKKVKVGTVYYNKKNDEIRIKTNDGWRTI